MVAGVPSRHEWSPPPPAAPARSWRSLAFVRGARRLRLGPRLGPRLDRRLDRPPGSHRLFDRLVGRGLHPDRKAHLYCRHLHAPSGVIQLHRHGLLGHVDRDHPSLAHRRRHLLPQLGELAPHVAVDVVLKGQAAEEAAAHTGDLVRIEREILRLGHADAHLRERRHPGGAAQPLSTDVVPVHQLGAIARPHLHHVQPDLVLDLDRLLHGPKVHGVVRLEERRALRALQVDLAGRHVHRQFQLPHDRAQALEHRVGPILHLRRPRSVLPRRHAADRFDVVGRRTGVGIGRDHHPRHLLAVRGRHHHVLARIERLLRGREVVDLRRLAEAHPQHVYAHLTSLSSPRVQSPPECATPAPPAPAAGSPRAGDVSASPPARA